MPDDGPVVDEEDIGDAAEPLQRLAFIGANRLVAQIAARGDDWETQLRHQQMVQRIRRQHHAEVGIARRNTSGNLRFEI